MKYVFIPIHIRDHWICSIVHVQDRMIETFDSLGGDNSEIFKVKVDSLTLFCFWLNLRNNSENR